jgi:hypothetical protein
MHKTKQSRKLMPEKGEKFLNQMKGLSTQFPTSKEGNYSKSTAMMLQIVEI